MEKQPEKSEAYKAYLRLDDQWCKRQNQPDYTDDEETTWIHRLEDAWWAMPVEERTILQDRYNAPFKSLKDVE